MFARAAVGWSIALPLSVFLTAGSSAQNDNRGQRTGSFAARSAPAAAPAAFVGPRSAPARIEVARAEPARASRGGDSFRESRHEDRGGSRHDSWGGRDRGRDWGHGSSTSISVSIGSSFGGGYRNSYAPSWRRDWCDPFPVPYCPPPVVYCPPPVVYCPPVVRYYPPPVVYCPPPVVYERPIVQTTYVVDQPRVIYADQPITRVYQPAPVVVQRGFVPAVDAETAALYWAGGDAARAIDGLRSYISDRPGSVKEIRLLGLINLDQGRAADAVGYVFEAYNLDPTLADRAFDPAAVGLGAEQFKRMQRSALDYVTQNGSPASWLTVITLLQAQGQRDLAQATMIKAVDAGLSVTIVDRFRTALGK